jgi:hypothetical protein
LERWLARQVGPLRPLPCAKRRSKDWASCRRTDKTSVALANAAAVELGSSTVTVPTGSGSEKLALVRSYQIPAGDPSYARLLNISWTYDSAVSAAAFVAAGAQAQAQQLLDQLAALQNTDGSIDYAFNVANGEGTPLYRSGTIAWMGLAGASYDIAFHTNRYLPSEKLAANYLLSLQGTNGLIRGGPDVKWVSTQHNLIVYAFLVRLGSELTQAGATSEAAHYQAAAAQIAAGIDTNLLVLEGSTAYFREGLEDNIQSLDVQALGAAYLAGRGEGDLGELVLAHAQSAFALSGRSISLSLEPSSYNETYSSPGPFTGYAPYIGSGAPNVLWFEGTAEMRMAQAALGQSTMGLDQSMSAWESVTAGDSGAPLQADQALSSPAYGVEYHVWPAAAAGAWVTLSNSMLTLFAPLPSYAQAIAADSPELWYRFRETSATTASDFSSTPHNGTYQGSVTLGALGPTSAVEASSAATLDGSSGYVSNAYMWINPQEFTLEAWVKTTSTQGGLIVGFASTPTGAAGSYDRQIYMANTSQIYFGAGANKTINSTRSYNEGGWHLIDATLSPAGMDLYVDGALVASNATDTIAQGYNVYWRVGYDSLGGWLAHPTSNFFAASIDEVAVYPTALGTSRVTAHYLAAQ